MVSLGAAAIQCTAAEILKSEVGFRGVISIFVDLAVSEGIYCRGFCY